jgi:hypothetical protein
MLKELTAIGLSTTAITLGTALCLPGMAEAATLWSWSFGTSQNGATGTFLTSDVSNINDPVGTYNVLQIDISKVNGIATNLQTNILNYSPQFTYSSSTFYGFINNLVWADSGYQSIGNGGFFRLTGSSAYVASQPAFKQVYDVVSLPNGPVASNTIGNLQVSLAQPTTIPTPALLPGLLGMVVATLRKRKHRQVEVSKV